MMTGGRKRRRSVSIPVGATGDSQDAEPATRYEFRLVGDEVMRVPVDGARKEVDAIPTDYDPPTEPEIPRETLLALRQTGPRNREQRAQERRTSRGFEGQDERYNRYLPKMIPFTPEDCRRPNWTEKHCKFVTFPPPTPAEDTGMPPEELKHG